MSNFSVLNFFDLVELLKKRIEDPNLRATDLVDIHEQMSMLMWKAENELFLSGKLDIKDQPGNLIWCFIRLFRTTNESRLRHKIWEVIESYMQATDDLSNLLTTAMKADDASIAIKIAQKMLRIGDETYVSNYLQSLSDKPHELATRIQSLLTKSE